MKTFGISIDTPRGSVTTRLTWQEAILLMSTEAEASVNQSINDGDVDDLDTIDCKAHFRRVRRTYGFEDFTSREEHALELAFARTYFMIAAVRAQARLVGFDIAAVKMAGH
jgi:hypothetical protein